MRNSIIRGKFLAGRVCPQLPVGLGASFVP